MHIKKLVKTIPFYKKIYAYRWRERIISRGSENEDICFYVIRRHSEKSGLFSFVMTNLGSIVYATQNGYIPVVDMMSSPNPMIESEQVGQINAWELFFAQPYGYSMKSIRKSKRIILGSINTPDDYPDYPILSDTKKIDYWRKAYHKYIHPIDEISNIAIEYYNKNLNEARSLGILCRGTDYTQNKPHNHPIQPDTETVISDAKKLMADYNLTQIYLATEDQCIWEKFNAAFPGNVISYQSTRFITSTNQNINDIGNAKLSPYERNKEYFISICVLSMCTALLAGPTSGSIGALLMSDGYEFYNIYQLGLYD